MNRTGYLDIIARKRDGKELSAAEIEAMIAGYTGGDIPDYQMAAWLMAIAIRGMSLEECAAMTLAMVKSGSVMDLSSVPGVKVDKHSTGGVADTTTLILGPLVAAAGVPVAKMSGRGLGFTGGTIDKLEAIPGFRTSLTQEEFIRGLKRIKIAISSPTTAIAPADGMIYALRDVTATVESIPLIAASVMSKKIAAGADKILLDVKTGTGAFMSSPAAAIELARTMVEIGRRAGKEVKALITSMEEPLGRAIGNSLEVREALEVLSGQVLDPELSLGMEPLRHLCLVLGAHLVTMAGISASHAEGYEKLSRILDDGLALAKFEEFVANQGGDTRIIQNPALLPAAPFCADVLSDSEGYVSAIDARRIGQAAVILGAGRRIKGEKIDLAAGIILKCRIGSKVRQGQTIATIYASAQNKLDAGVEAVRQAIAIGAEEVQPPTLILGLVDEFGFHSV